MQKCKIGPGGLLEVRVAAREFADCLIFDF
jgi:hypothetical protein